MIGTDQLFSELTAVLEDAATSAVEGQSSNIENSEVHDLIHTLDMQLSQARRLLDQINTRVNCRTSKSPSALE